MKLPISKAFRANGDDTLQHYCSKADGLEIEIAEHGGAINGTS